MDRAGSVPGISFKGIRKNGSVNSPNSTTQCRICVHRGYTGGGSMSKKAEFIRKQPCCIPYCRDTKSQFCHVTTSENRGTSQKPDDKYTVPMCHRHHILMQHQKGYQAVLEHATGREWGKYEAKQWFLDQANKFEELFNRRNNNINPWPLFI